ncbi:sterol carrier family protein [Actinocorallia longicatena]|uniref:Sterol carrier family protein n=1 Tax=Actinocorallia longicatena TaxID=111803 RepID=A0ABP6QGE7_9ACTN
MKSDARTGGEALAATLAAYEADEPPGRSLEKAAVKHVLSLLGDRAPGKAVEVRIPPHAAIQCVEGTTHTRGTPPNVVETDARTLLGLATGALSWPETVRDGRVRATGTRADLSAYLPLV